jgi:hypothetical protein
VYAAAILGCVLLSAPARAQTAPVPPPTAPAVPTIRPAIGEDYWIEMAAGVWATMPSTVQYSDTENSLTGTVIDFKQQLGLSDQRFPEFHLVVRLARRHKLLGEYIPLIYNQTATPTTTLNFAGQPFPAGQAVSSTLRSNAWRGAYEYDFVTADRGYVGGILGVNDVDVIGTLTNASSSVSADVQIPMPGLGAIVRYYPWARLSITGEIVGYDLPGRSANTHGHAVDFDAYAAANISRHLGIQGGYRVFDVNYAFAASQNTGVLTIGGPYIAGFVRF